MASPAVVIVQALGALQWSRPVVGRMTITKPGPVSSWVPPQWSRPLAGRVMSHPCRYRSPGFMPQSGRPAGGRMTGSRGSRCSVFSWAQ